MKEKQMKMNDRAFNMITSDKIFDMLINLLGRYQP